MHCLISEDAGESNEVTGGGNKQPPEIALEWTDMKVSFRIVSEYDFENNPDPPHYEIFPKLDPSAPSARSIPLLKRKATKEKNNGSTLSSWLGYPPSHVLPPAKVYLGFGSIQQLLAHVSRLTCHDLV